MVRSPRRGDVNAAAALELDAHAGRPRDLALLLVRIRVEVHQPRPRCQHELARLREQPLALLDHRPQHGLLLRGELPAPVLGAVTQHAPAAGVAASHRRLQPLHLARVEDLAHRRAPRVLEHHRLHVLERVHAALARLGQRRHRGDVGRLGAQQRVEAAAPEGMRAQRRHVVGAARLAGAQPLARLHRHEAQHELLGVLREGDGEVEHVRVGVVEDLLEGEVLAVRAERALPPQTLVQDAAQRPQVHLAPRGLVV
mmetsp:Transcript_3320/g.12036  ORF Transcript_3320/g.12036 Transcript_3320/m.12036 type:complete len:255 (-) Transcript_3320:1370-2134(-)